LKIRNPILARGLVLGLILATIANFNFINVLSEPTGYPEYWKLGERFDHMTQAEILKLRGLP